MANYKLSARALGDMAELLTYAHREVDPALADKSESLLFRVFNAIAEGRIVGHRRRDLTERDVLFTLAPPFLVIFRKTKSLVHIIRVVHGARDVKRLL